MQNKLMNEFIELILLFWETEVTVDYWKLALIFLFYKKENSKVAKINCW